MAAVYSPPVSAQRIDGNEIAAQIRAEVQAAVAAYVKAGNRAPHLSVILVGDDPASHSYVRGKTSDCREVGMSTDTLELPASISQRRLLEEVERLNSAHNVHGILVQMPLPEHIDAEAVMRAIDPRKDVDGLHPENLGRLVQGAPGLVPCTPAGVQQMLVRSGHDPAGKRVVVVGRSTLVGKPLALLLAGKGPGANATVVIAHTGTRDLAAVTREADILIVAVGRPGIVTAEMVRPGAVVIDVGINRVADASRRSGFRLVGDVDTAAVAEVAAAITPVPGGVGPMTRAMLLVNTLRAARALSDGRG